jgi:hypothetical protein
MSVPEFEKSAVVQDAEAILKDTKRQLIPVSTEFPLLTARSICQVIQTEYNYVASKLKGGVSTELEVLRDLEEKFSLDSTEIEPTLGSILVDVTGNDIDRINKLLLERFDSEDAECEMYTLLHEVNQAFIEAGGEIRPMYATFFADDREVA